MALSRDPHFATATTKMTNGTVTHVQVADVGFGYDTPPQVYVYGGGGSGAKAVATLENGQVTAIALTDQGVGYTSAPKVSIASPSSLAVPGVWLSIERETGWGDTFPLTTPIPPFPTNSRPKLSNISGNLVQWGHKGPILTNDLESVSEAVSIVGDYEYALVLRHNGTVAVWGGSAPSPIRAVPSNLGRVVALAAEWGHAIALNSDGTVIAWGANDGRQSNVPAGLTNVVAVAAGQYHSLALKANGSIVGWGRGLGASPFTSNFRAISASGYHSVALKNDGTAYEWGTFFQDQRQLASSMSNLVAVSAGYTHVVALKADGTVVSWGSNDYGQTNVPVGLAGVVAVAAVNRHSMALRANGTVVAWGRNVEGQTDVPEGLSGVFAIGGGTQQSFALVKDGIIRVDIVMNVLPGRTYQIQVSMDLLNWFPAGSPFVAESESINQEFVAAETGRYFQLVEVP